MALFLGATLGLNSAHSASASDWFFRDWQVDDGLPGNDVSGIAQAGEGWLWVATQSGLASFDGLRFREVPLAIPSRRDHPIIRCQALGQREELWLALEGGLVVQIGKTVTNVFTPKEGLVLFKPTSLAQSRDGAVWVSYVDGSVCRIQHAKITRFTARDGLSGVGPCWLATDMDGQLWFAKAGQLGRFRTEKFEALFALPAGPARLGAARDGGIWICAGRQLLKSSGLTNPPVEVGRLTGDRAGVEPAVILETRTGDVWIGTSIGGLFHFDGVGFQRVATSHADILALGEDHEGNLWVGTGGGGLNRVRPRFLHLEGATEGLPLATIRSVSETAAGELWAVAQNGELSRRIQNRWHILGINDGWGEVKANCVLSDRSGGVWVGTYRGGLHRWNGKAWTNYQRADGMMGDLVRGLFEDSRSNLWIALEGNVCVQRLSQGNFQTFAQPAGSRAVRAMAEDARGGVWFGTTDGLLLRADGDQLINETPGTLANPKPIRCLTAASDGSLWIAYAGAGLGRLKAGKFTQISVEQGLYDSHISVLTQDAEGAWWLGADRGLFRIGARELERVADGAAGALRLVVYGRDEALPNLQANYGYAPGFVRARDGRLWFPMRTGLAVIQPSRVPPSRIPPRVFLERVSVDGRALAIGMGESLRLPPEHRRLEVEFTAFTFVAPENVAFRYRLDGWDDEWVNNGTQRRITYPRLPAGQYELRVAARSNAGDWNPVEARLQFRVGQFYWQTWWFRVTGLGVFTVVLVALVRYGSHRRLRAALQRLEQEAALQRERARIAKDIHDDLGASLTQISLLGKLAEQDLSQPGQAAARVREISAAAREGVKAVDEIVWAVNPRNDTAAHFLDYAGQFAVDYLRTAGIRCRIDFPANVPELALNAHARHGLFLVLKESLNNVVKHSGAGEVWLRAALAGRTLSLAIEDNGHGFVAGPTESGSDGLRNMQQRLAEIGGRCQVTSGVGAGTRVRLELELPDRPPTVTWNGRPES